MASQKQGNFWTKIVLLFMHSEQPSLSSVLGKKYTSKRWRRDFNSWSFDRSRHLCFICYSKLLFPTGDDYAWEKVYPELMDDAAPVSRKEEKKGVGLTANMDKMLAEANITPEIFGNLGKSFKGLTETVSKIGDLTDATVATNDYAKNVKSASSAISDMNKSYGVAINAMSSMADATKDAQQYRDQFQNITKNMGALNAVYELELQDTTKHLKAMNAFYGNLTTAMANMADATKESQQFKAEMSKLTTNISSLNNVYGNMLTAMRG
ncbi:MAG: gliding motility protein GldL [Spirosomataceae bacterium]